jgi:hypothetical protein
MKTNIFYQDLGDKQSLLRQLRQPFQESTPSVNLHKSQRIESKQGVRIRNLGKSDKLLHPELAKSSNQAAEILTSRASSLAKQTPTSKMKKMVFLSRGFIVEGSPIKTDGRVNPAPNQFQPENKQAKEEKDQSRYLNMKLKSENSLKMSVDNLNTRGYELANMIDNITSSLENRKLKRQICMPIQSSNEKQVSAGSTPVVKPLFYEDTRVKDPMRDSKVYRIVTSRPSAKSPDIPIHAQNVNQKSPFSSPQKFLSQTRAAGFGKGSDWSQKQEVQKHLHAKSQAIGPSNPLYYVRHP